MLYPDFNYMINIKYTFICVDNWSFIILISPVRTVLRYHVGYWSIIRCQTFKVAFTSTESIPDSFVVLKLAIIPVSK